MFEFPTNVNWEVQFQALKNFLIEWYGAFDPAHGINLESMHDLHLPKPLKALHAFAGNRDQVVRSQNRLIRPSKLDLKEEKLIFYVENQWVYLWATEKDKENPRVFGKLNKEEEQWQEESEPLSGFLFEICLFEAIMGLTFGASASYLQPNELKEILSLWQPIPYGPWRWPAYPTKFYHVNGALALVSPNKDRFSFYCSTQDAKYLSFMTEFIDDMWEFVEL